PAAALLRRRAPARGGGAAARGPPALARGPGGAPARDRRDSGRGPALRRPGPAMGNRLRRMGGRVVPRAAAEVGRPNGVDLPPTFRSVLGRGLPGFLREGFLPLGAFYAGLEVSGLLVAMAAAAAAALAVYGYERAAGRDGLLVRLSLLF